MSDRIGRVSDIFSNFEWLDLSDARHRDVIDKRLNQNFLLGAAIDRLESGQVEYASGASATDLMLGLIPRAIWPDKPKIGGGGTIVQDFTGMEFAGGTSVGAGQVFEFYVNFGTLGVIGGFLLYGWIMARIDLRIIYSLTNNNRRSYVMWWLVGLALLQPGGNLMEVVVTAVASAITGRAIGSLIAPQTRAAEISVVPPS
jgi:hypothetical protein